MPSRTVVLLALTFAGAMLVGCSGSDPADRTTAASSRGATDTSPTADPAQNSHNRGIVDGWTSADDLPLAPRTDATTVWTGEELLLLGGIVDRCPPNADCNYTGPVFRDGAALDPATGRWRMLEDAPSDLWPTEAVAVGGDAYLWASSRGVAYPQGSVGSTFLRYDLTADEWQELPVPVEVGDGAGAGGAASSSLVAAGRSLVSNPGTDERGERPAQLFEPATESWSELPDDPLPDLFDRAMVWEADHLYLFGKAVVPNPGSEEPALVIGARLGLSSDGEVGTWERLPDSSLLGGALRPAGGGLLVDASLSSADGGEVNNWGRSYPYGGTFDTNTSTWAALPDAPGEQSAGFVGLDRAELWGVGGLVLDVQAASWVPMAPPPGGEKYSRVITTAGRDAVALGGVDEVSEGEVLVDTWIWRLPS